MWQVGYVSGYQVEHERRLDIGLVTWLLEVDHFVLLQIDIPQRGNRFTVGSNGSKLILESMSPELGDLRVVENVAPYATGDQFVSPFIEMAAWVPVKCLVVILEHQHQVEEIDIPFFQIRTQTRPLGISIIEYGYPRGSRVKGSGHLFIRQGFRAGKILIGL